MAFKGHRREWAGRILWNAFGGGKIPMHWDGNWRNMMGLLPLLSCKEEFLVVHRKGVCESILQPGVGRPAGMWKAQRLGLGMEPGELAAPAFPSPGHCKVFVLLLSLSHSFILNKTCWFSVRWRGRNSPEITKWDGKTGLLPPKNEGESWGWLPEACPQVWSMPGIPPPVPNWALAITASGKLLNVVKHRRGRKKSYIKVINESKSALCQGSGSRGNLSVR